jgi:hypothetical protein
VLLSLLAGWWFYALESLTARDPGMHGAAGLIYFLASAGFIGGRLLHYGVGYGPPISLWGRLWTGRWIMPSYDRIFLAPLCGTAAFLSGMILYAAFDVDGPVLALFLTIVVMTSLVMGPRLENWRLTGNHRLTSRGLPPREFEQL